MFHPVQMARYRRKLMQTLQSLKEEDPSVETALEAFSMASFLEEFDSAVEKLYTDFMPSVVEKVQKFGMMLLYSVYMNSNFSESS